MEYSIVGAPGVVGDSNFGWEEDLQLLLESPTAQAASANFFSSRLGTLDSYATHGFYGSSGTPDLNRHLNMAYTSDANLLPDPPHTQNKVPPGFSQPGVWLQPPWSPPANQETVARPALRRLEQQQWQRPQHVRQLHSKHRPTRAASPPAPASVPASFWIPQHDVLAPSVVPQPIASLHLRERGHQQTQPKLYLSSNNHVIQSHEAQAALQLHSTDGEASLPEALPAAGETLTIDGTSWQHQHVAFEDLPVTQLLHAEDSQQHDAASMPLEWAAGGDELHEGSFRASSQQPPVPASIAGTAADNCAAVSGVAAVSSAPCQAGTLVWAKYPRFPWWPAVVISPTADVPDPPPGLGNSSHPVLVRFLGTYDASWVDPHKAVSSWTTNMKERSNKTKSAAFLAALREAKTYCNTGVLPKAFQSLPSLLQAPSAAKGTRTRSKQEKTTVESWPIPDRSVATMTATEVSAETPSLSPQLPGLKPGGLYPPAPPASHERHVLGVVQELDVPGAVEDTVQVSAAGDVDALTQLDSGRDSDVAHTDSKSSKSRQSRVGRKSSLAVVKGPAAGLRSVSTKRATSKQSWRGSRRTRNA